MLMRMSHQAGTDTGINADLQPLPQSVNTY